MIGLKTPRLELRPLELADAAQSQKLFPHWEIVKFLASHVPWPYPADGALTYYRDAALPAIARGDEWHWTLRLKTEPDQLIGCISLLRAENNNRGFWLGLPWRRQGLMTEAVEAVTRYWFDRLGFEVLRAPKAVANTASRRISESGKLPPRSGERAAIIRSAKPPWDPRASRGARAPVLPARRSGPAALLRSRMSRDRWPSLPTDA